MGTWESLGSVWGSGFWFVVMGNVSGVILHYFSVYSLAAICVLELTRLEK